MEEDVIVGCLPHQGALKARYDSIPAQISVAGVILLNFIVSICEYQMLPAEDSEAMSVFEYFELVFNSIFGIELVINFYSNFFLDFWRSPWNIFDFVIVAIAWVAYFVPGIPGITVLRLFRAFRVFKLFKKIEAIRVIMVGITRSLPGVGNAFVLLCLVMGIWSIMGVQFFRLDFPDEFGCFSKAMLTMFQLATFDSWVSGVARPVVLHKNASIFGAPFFVSYAFMSAIIMMNVVVAILLDKFIMASKEVKEDLVREKAARRLAQEEKKLAQAALVFQTIVREYRIPIATKRLLRRSRMGAVTIQKIVRGFLARRRYKVMLKEYRATLGVGTDSLVQGDPSDNDGGLDETDRSRVEAIKEVRRRILKLEASFESRQKETMELVRKILARTTGSQKEEKEVGSQMVPVETIHTIQTEEHLGIEGNKPSTGCLICKT